MAFVTNKKAFLDTLRAAEGEMKRKFAWRVMNVVHTLHHEIVALTPVWSGSAVANYQWSAGLPRFELIEPIDNGPPGHTNEMPLGTEPRREPNEALSLESLEALSFANPYQVFWLSNNDPDIMGIEIGTKPPPPLQIRNPQGMIAVSLEYVYAKLQAGQM